MAGDDTCMKREKGAEFDIVLWIFVAVFLLLILAPASLTLVNNAQNSVEGCSMWASMLSDITGGLVQLC